MGIADPMFLGDLQRRIVALERQLRNLTSGRRLEDASIGARGITVRGGGSITIDGGTLKLIDENGVVVAYWGDVFFGGTSRGWELNFDSGRRAFGLGGEPGNQAWQLWDEAGNYIITNDAFTGVGLARPYLNIPMYPSRDSQHHTGGPMWPATNSGSYVELMHGFTSLWHPRLAFGMDETTTAGTTEWRLLLSGVLIAEGAGAVSEIYNIPEWGDDDGIKPAHERVVQVEARNTGGGISWVQVDKCYGLQS